jgi:hypothetical protein
MEPCQRVTGDSSAQAGGRGPDPSSNAVMKPVPDSRQQVYCFCASS